ncbi:type II toxin-antitoxin system PrlF family antitoxin [Candidatus Bipolaricaulota bacterium]|nr:type II toxin-antitoxin system PrlF family antitoxin [Candidatus Bipolaricaulota bacterium]
MVGTKVTAKGQTTIPKPIRDALGLKPGDRVLFVRKKEGVMLVPASGTLREQRGTVAPRRRPEDFAEVREGVKKARGKRA